MISTTLAAKEAAEAGHPPPCDPAIRWAAAALRAVRRDENMRQRLDAICAEPGSLARVGCPCEAERAADFGASGTAPPPAVFRSLVFEEANIEGASVVQSRHAVVAGLRCLPELAATLGQPGSLDRMRAGLRHAREDVPGVAETQPPIAPPVIDALRRANAIGRLVWWPGMWVVREQAADAAIALDVLLADEKLVGALAEAGFDRAVLVRTIEEAGRGAAGLVEPFLRPSPPVP